MLTKIKFNHHGNTVGLDAKKCSLFGMFRGLMFRRLEKARVLLFDFGKSVRTPIHSWFVFFPFVAIWLDDKDEVIEIKRVKPWKFCVLPKQKFWKLIEIPCSKRYSKELMMLGV